jgi:hypothetical protein
LESAHRDDPDESVSSVDVGPVIDIEEVNHACRYFDSVPDAVRTASSTAATCQRAEQGFADTVRVRRKWPGTELQDGRCDNLGQGLGDRPAGRTEKADLVRRISRQHRP